MFEKRSNWFAEFESKIRLATETYSKYGLVVFRKTSVLKLVQFQRKLVLFHNVSLVNVSTTEIQSNDGTTGFFKKEMASNPKMTW